MRLRLPPWAAFALGLAAFVALALTVRGLESSLALGVAASHGLLKTSMLALALAVMVLDGRPWADFGFRRATGVRWGRVVGSGALLGALATGMILVSPARGLGMIKEMSLVQIAVGVWLGSSLAEEVFFRGLIQSVVRPGPGLSILRTPLSAPVLVSGLSFGALHLGLLLRGTDAWTVGILFIFTTALGLVAGRFREESGSLWPAFIAHVAFNLGGLPVGVAAAIAKKLAS